MYKHGFPQERSLSNLMLPLLTEQLSITVSRIGLQYLRPLRNCGEYAEQLKRDEEAVLQY